MDEPRKKLDDIKISAKEQGKVGEYAFKGQHSFAGGFSSCTANVLQAIAIFSHMSNEAFFRHWPLPVELNTEQKAHSCAILSAICEAGNKLSLEPPKPKEDKDKKVGFFDVCKALTGKEFSVFLEKIQTSMQGHENIKDLLILQCNDKCPKEDLERHITKMYKIYNLINYRVDDIYFISEAAHHTVGFFAKTRPGDKKTFFYVYDTSPSRAFGGNKKIGLLEIFINASSAVEALKTRWTWKLSADQFGQIYTVSTHTRKKEIEQQVQAEIAARARPSNQSS